MLALCVTDNTDNNNNSGKKWSVSSLGQGTQNDIMSTVVKHMSGSIAM